MAMIQRYVLWIQSTLRAAQLYLYMVILEYTIHEDWRNGNKGISWNKEIP